MKLARSFLVFLFPILIFAQQPSIQIEGEIEENLVLTAQMKVDLSAITEKNIKLYQNAAGQAPNGEFVLKLISLTLDGQSLVVDPHGDWVNIPSTNQGRMLVIDYKINLKDIYDWRSSFGYALFPAHNTNNTWYPDLYLNDDRNFFKDFEVSLRHPENLILLTSGQVVAQKVENGVKKSSFTAKNIRFFGLNAGENFILGQEQANGVDITYFCTKDLENVYRGAAKVTAEAINWYVKTYGFFPIKHIGIGLGNPRWSGGFPSENLFYIHQGNMTDEYIQWITAHELGHYYWGHYVLSNEEDNLNGLMLASGIWLDHLYMSKVNDQALEDTWNSGKSQSGMMTRYLTAVLRNVDQRLGLTRQQVQDIGFDYNSLIAHGKAATGLYLLSREVGFDKFLEVQKKIVQDYQYRPLPMSDFIRLCQEAGWSKAGQFMTQWSKGNAMIEYEIRNLKKEKAGERWSYSFELRKRGTVDYPIEIEIRDQSGQSYFLKSGGEEEREMIKGTTQSEPVSFQLDPNGAVPMWNSSHPAIQRLYILALDRAGHTVVARELAKRFLELYPEDEVVSNLVK